MIKLPVTHLYSLGHATQDEVIPALRSALLPFGSVMDAGRAAELMCALLDSRPAADKADDLIELWGMLDEHESDPSAGEQNIAARLTVGVWSVGITTPGGVAVTLKLRGVSDCTDRRGGRYEVVVDFGRASTNCASAILYYSPGAWTTGDL